MIEDAGSQRYFKPGVTIIEPTSGNTGIGLAFCIGCKGYKLILTMPDTMSVERRNLLKAFWRPFGAHARCQWYERLNCRAEELREETPNSIILQQFENPTNPAIHEKQPVKRYGMIPTVWTMCL